MRENKQLLLDFIFNKSHSKEDFFVSECNFFAFNLLETWPKWERNILNIYGEKFSGKSHLANIFCNKNKCIKITEEQLNDEILKKLKLHENIVLDNFAL